MKAFWGVLLATLVPAYLIGAGVLMHYGYNTYFGISPEYISTSASFYAIFAMNIYALVAAIISTITWWQWPLLFLGLGLVWLVYASSRIGQILVLAAIVFLLIKILFGMIYIGDLIARTQTRFLVPSADCKNLGDSKKYVVSVIRGSEAVFIPIDENYIMRGSFFVKNIPELGCGLTYTTGKIVQHM